MEITIYTTPQCFGCRKSKQLFDEAGVPYTAIDVTEDPAAAARIKALGFTQAPVIVAGTTSWSGLQPERIKAAVIQYAATNQHRSA